MAYVTTKHIRDLQDNEHYYRKGDAYPREGLEVSEERFQELIDGGYIMSDEVAVVLEEETPNLNELKKDELIALAHSKGVDFNESDTKAEIIEKLGE